MVPARGRRESCEDGAQVSVKQHLPPHAQGFPCLPPLLWVEGFPPSGQSFQHPPASSQGFWVVMHPQKLGTDLFSPAG